MTELGDLIASRIRATGPLTVAEFMAEALQHPRLGYYATRDPLGSSGDFITAPEISQVFGELIGLWCADTWERIGRPAPVLAVELGPGRGTLMADALRALAVAPDVRRALQLHLVETSRTLRARQAETLAAAAPAWHDTLASVPAAPMLLVANEFLDALPIRQFERAGDGWRERRVGLASDGHSLAFLTDPVPSVAATLLPAALAEAPAGSIAETCPAALVLAASLGERLQRHGGAALFIDYGHADSACGDTLQAVRRHAYHAVLEAPGSADLTAHVDFAAFAAAARAAGAGVHGPVTQGDFLRALGIEARLARLLRSAAPAQRHAIESGVHRLIDRAEMGTLFKVVALTRADAPAPAGFPETVRT
ncbi:MAG TPA: SAM-dependent methyltransferase [Stellaceae bacterium]|nr:SAM-dependent methyltransferase [Stellaceae bacterium]